MKIPNKNYTMNTAEIFDVVRGEWRKIILAKRCTKTEDEARKVYVVLIFGRKEQIAKIKNI